MKRRGLLWLHLHLYLLPLLPAWAAPPPIEMPDVRANVMKMLQEAKAQGMATVIEEEFQAPTPSTTGFAGADAPQSSTLNPATDEDLFRQALEQERHAGEEAGAVVSPPLAPEQPPAEHKRNNGYVPLPNKVITIHDLQDIRQLSDEFEQAKRRGQER